MTSGTRKRFAEQLAAEIQMACDLGSTIDGLSRAIAKEELTKALCSHRSSEDSVTRSVGEWAAQLEDWWRGQALPIRHEDLVLALRAISPGTDPAPMVDLWHQAIGLIGRSQEHNPAGDIVIEGNQHNVMGDQTLIQGNLTTVHGDQTLVQGDSHISIMHNYHYEPAKGEWPPSSDRPQGGGSTPDSPHDPQKWPTLRVRAAMLGRPRVIVSVSAVCLLTGLMMILLDLMSLNPPNGRSSHTAGAVASTAASDDGSTAGPGSGPQVNAIGPIQTTLGAKYETEPVRLVEPKVIGSAPRLQWDADVQRHVARSSCGPVVMASDIAFDYQGCLKRVGDTWYPQARAWNLRASAGARVADLYLAVVITLPGESTKTWAFGSAPAQAGPGAAGWAGLMPVRVDAPRYDIAIQVRIGDRHWAASSQATVNGR